MSPRSRELQITLKSKRRAVTGAPEEQLKTSNSVLPGGDTNRRTPFAGFWGKRNVLRIHNSDRRDVDDVFHFNTTRQ